MRTEQERQSKLAECLTHERPKYRANGDCSVWEYWNTFGSILRSTIEYPSDQAGLHLMRRCAMAFGKHQIAAMYTWMLEPPTPIIDDEGRERGYQRAKSQGKPMYLWPTSKGTRVSATKPNCRCEVIEPPCKPRKRNLLVHVPAAFRRKAE